MMQNSLVRHMALSAPRAMAQPAFQAVPAQPPKAELDGANLFRWFCFYTPVLWGLGGLTLAAGLMVIRLCVARWPRGLAINAVVASWLAIALVQAVTSLLHGLDVGHFVDELPNLSSLAIFGWVFGALIIAMGSAHRLGGPRTVRAVTVLGLYMLVLAAAALPLRLGGVATPGLPATPLGLLLPASNTVRFYTSAVLYMPESTFGEKTARLILFFPWYTALGLGAVSVAFISALERNVFWRMVGMAGGVVATVFSWSRIAIFCLVVVGAGMVFVRLPRNLQIVSGLLGVAALCVAVMVGFDPIHSYFSAQDAVDAARRGSNMARDLIYTQSWEGFLDSPYFGNGLNFPPAHRTEPIAIGSHSTTYGLLYTAGAPGLVAFLVAMFVTFLALIKRYASLAPDSAGRPVVVVGIGLTTCLAFYCKFEALYSLTLPCIVLFAWIGACLPSPAEDKSVPVAAAPVTRTARRRGDRVFAAPNAMRPVRALQAIVSKTTQSEVSVPPTPTPYRALRSDHSTAIARLTDRRAP